MARDSPVNDRRRTAETTTTPDFEFTSIEGKPLLLSEWRGKPVLVVDTASRCQVTPRFPGLQQLSERFRDRGLLIIAVPSNDFGDQELGAPDPNKTFCETEFEVTFPVVEKQSVIGTEAHPFFKWIEDEFGEAAAPRWNFHRYLIAPDGTLAGAWPSRVPATSEDIIKLFEATLPE